MCLQALAVQTYGENLLQQHDEQRAYEVIVVDNASDLDEQISSLTAEFPFVVYAFEPEPGAYAARNRGLQLARGGVLAFTDADCIPRADWIERGVEHLLRVPHCGLVAGQICLFFQGDRANPVELYESVTAFPQQLLLSQQKGAATANVFTFRAVMDAVGPFDASLRSQGDLEWGQRVHAAGYRQHYAAEVCVAHPARYTFEQLKRRTIRLAGGAFGRQVQPAQGWLNRNVKFIRLLLEDLLPPVNFALSALKDDRLRNLREKAVVPLVLMWVRGISAREKVRLRLGGVPSRG